MFKHRTLYSAACRLFAAVGLLTLLAAPTSAAPQATTPVKVENAVISGVYATAIITTPADDRLMNVYAPGGIAMIHTIIRHKMVLTSIPFRANTPRRLSAHGYHIMLMHKLKSGTTFPASLIFDKAGEVKVVFAVK